MKQVSKHANDILLFFGILLLVASVMWFMTTTLPDSLSRQDYATQQFVLTAIAPLRYTLTVTPTPTPAPLPPLIY